MAQLLPAPRTTTTSSVAPTDLVRRMLTEAHDVHVRPLCGGAGQVSECRMVDVAGVPHLVLPRCLRVEPGPVRLTCDGRAAGPGVLSANGTVHAPAAPEERLDVASALAAHRGCLPDRAWTSCPCGRVVVARLVLQAAWVTPRPAPATPSAPLGRPRPLQR